MTGEVDSIAWRTIVRLGEVVWRQKQIIEQLQLCWDDDMTVSLNQQIDEVKRELKQRAEVYPRLVQNGKIKQSHADYQTERMQAVLKTLEWLQRNEDKVRIIMTE